MEIIYFITIKYYINFRNDNPNWKIITQFKLSLGPPCAKSSEINWIEVLPNEVEKDYHCSTSINGQTTCKLYYKVSDSSNNAGINIISLYKDNDLNPPSYKISSLKSAYVDLYARFFNDIDEKCVEEFINDMEEEKKYYVSTFKAVRALSLIGLILILVLFIYILTTCNCCCNLSYHGIAIVVPVYGLVANIIIIGITNKARTKYKCQKEDFNSELDDFIDDQYGNNFLI